MNITFLIGNGFDVGIGMRSSFKNFFPIYQEQSQKKPKRIKQLSDTIGDNHETWADFETEIGKYTINFNKDTKQDFLDQVKDFEEEFIAYLKKEEAALIINEDVESVIVNALLEYYLVPNLSPESYEAIKNVYDSCSAESHFYNFVNFNYTFTLEKCLEKVTQKIVRKRKYGGSDRVDKIGKVVHVHGHCNLFPIIGVNDVSQIANKELADDDTFTRFLVKPSINKLLRQGNDVNATSIINESKIICVYGMSLGATDKKWWELLVKWLAGSSNRQLIVFDYDEKYTPSTPFVWLEKEDSIISKLSDYSADSEIIPENLRSRIHIAVHKNIFAMNLSRNNIDEWISLISKLR